MTGVTCRDDPARWITCRRSSDLDEAAVYNRALTAKEIADHFAAAGK
jgi:hypothetical protein